MHRATVHAPDVRYSYMPSARRRHVAHPARDGVRDVIKRWRPSFESWRLSVFRSQSGQGWDLAISGPRFRKVFTLYGPADDLPGLVTAYVDAILAEAALTPRRT